MVSTFSFLFVFFCPVNPMENLVNCINPFHSRIRSSLFSYHSEQTILQCLPTGTEYSKLNRSTCSTTIIEVGRGSKKKKKTRHTYLGRLWHACYLVPDTLLLLLQPGTCSPVTWQRRISLNFSSSSFTGTAYVMMDLACFGCLLACVANKDTTNDDETMRCDGWCKRDLLSLTGSSIGY